MLFSPTKLSSKTRLNVVPHFVYKFDVAKFQVLFLLSSIYQPQNEYCIAVGENSAPAFLILLKELANCFPNVYFMVLFI